MKGAVREDCTLLFGGEIPKRSPPCAGPDSLNRTGRKQVPEGALTGLSAKESPRFGIANQL
jgi:hypothetical protein